VPADHLHELGERELDAPGLVLMEIDGQPVHAARARVAGARRRAASRSGPSTPRAATSPAMEAPDLLLDDLRAFFRPLR
jgi:hypothetical protein